MPSSSARIVSVSTALFDGYPIERAVEDIARSGGRHVEPAFIKGYVDFDETAFSTKQAAHLRSVVEGGGLSIHALSAHLDLSLPDAPDALGRRIGFAAGLGASYLVTNSGPAAQSEAILRVIEKVVPLLEDAGVTLAVENPGHGHGNLTGHGKEAAKILRRIGSDRVGLNHDAGNVFTYSAEAVQPADDIATALDMVRHVHLKDVARSGAGWSFCALGDGAVDLDSYWALLPQAMPVSIELPLRLHRPGRRDPVRKPDPADLSTIRRALLRSLQYVETLDMRPAAHHGSAS